MPGFGPFSIKEKIMEKKKDDNLHFAVGMGGLVLLAVVSTKQFQIKNWLYEHMMTIVLIAFAIVGLLVYRAIHRMKKKEEELIKRMKAVNSVAPEKARDDYYRRKR
jgi:hypothetical protein